MLLGRDVIGEFFDCGIQKLDGEEHKECRDHGDVPGQARRMKTPIGTASPKTIASSRMAASVLMPSAMPRNEFLVALKSRFTARRAGLCGSAGPPHVAA